MQKGEYGIGSAVERLVSSVGIARLTFTRATARHRPTRDAGELFVMQAFRGRFEVLHGRYTEADLHSAPPAALKSAETEARYNLGGAWAILSPSRRRAVPGSVKELTLPLERRRSSTSKCRNPANR